MTDGFAREIPIRWTVDLYDKSGQTEDDPTPMILALNHWRESHPNWTITSVDIEFDWEREAWRIRFVAEQAWAVDA